MKTLDGKEQIIHDNGHYMMTKQGREYFVYLVVKRRGNKVRLYGFRNSSRASAERVYAACIGVAK